MTVIGRLLLYAMTGFEVAVPTTKRLYVRRDFRGGEMAVSAKTGHWEIKNTWSISLY